MLNASAMVKYDVQTLLALSQNARIELNRFSDQAFGNNLLRPYKATPGILTEHVANNQSRKVSSISNQTEISSTPTNVTVNYPTRQPRDPPPEVGAQFDAGFVRFLKEHTSPRHQRVTAGGRIVPMNPSLSAPKWDLPTSSGQPSNLGGSDAMTVFEKDKPNNQPGQEENPSINPISNPATLSPGAFAASNGLPFMFGDTNSSSSTLSQSNSSLMLNYPQNTNADQAQGYFAPMQQDYIGCGPTPDPAVWVPNVFQGVNPQDPMLTAMPNHMQPYQAPSTTSGFANCNGVNTVAPMGFDQFQQAYNPVSSSAGQPWSNAVNPQQPAFNQQYIPPQIQEAMYQKALDDAKRRHDSLSSQLGRVDRYMALHGWNIEPNTKRGLVEQRMTLVRELDTLRVYKEHLYFLFGKVKVSVPAPQKETVVAPGSQALYVGGNPMGEQQLLGPGPFAPGFNYAGPMFPMPPLANTPQQPFPASERPYSRSSSWQNTEYTNQPPDNPWAGNVSTLEDSLKSLNLSDHQLAKNPNPRVTLSQLPAQHTSHRTAEDAVSVINAPETPTKTAPAEVRRLYRQIEDATRHGKPIENLLQELSIVTSRLAQKQSVERNQTLHLPSSATPTQNSKASVRFKPTPVVRSGLNGAARYPVQHSRRFWQSDDYPQKFRVYRRTGPIQATDDDQQSCASHLSTTDSWVTTQEGEKRWLDRELQNCQPHPTKNLQSWVKNPSRYRTGSAETRMSSLRSTTVPIAPVEPTSVLSDPVNSFAGTPIWQGHKTLYPPLLTQCFSGDRSPALQKTTALAVSQNVNAHGFLPHADGAGDTPTLNDKVQAKWNGGKNQGPGPKKKRSQMPKKSVRPSTAVARDK